MIHVPGWLKTVPTKKWVSYLVIISVSNRCRNFFSQPFPYLSRHLLQAWPISQSVQNQPVPCVAARILALKFVSKPERYLFKLYLWFALVKQGTLAKCGQLCIGPGWVIGLD